MSGFAKFFHNIPHFTLTFRRVEPSFVLDLKSSYIQSLLVFLVLGLLLGTLLLLTIIITWICQCCTRQDPSIKSRRKVQHISTVLFIISILCFFTLGISLFANEHVNRGVISSVNGLGYVTENFHLAYLQCSVLNETLGNATYHVEQLQSELENEKRIPAREKTMLQNAVDSLSQKMNVLRSKIGNVKVILSDFATLDKVKRFGQTAEFERWVLLVTLLSIMLIVLFVGVIAFCRQSKKGAVMFSGLGFAIFIVGWILLAVVFPLTISWADFCLEGEAFMKKSLSEEMMQTLDFYKNCENRQTPDNIPGAMNLKDISIGLSDIQKIATEVDTTLHKIFNGTEENSTDVRLILDDVSRSFKSAGALDNQVACFRFHNDVNGMKRGFCEAGMFGSAIMVASLFSLGFFMFILLLIVSKSWYLFKKGSADYVEADDEDPFFPRGNESTIPVDIYGTHFYNPRTRNANSLDHTEPSTGTTIAPGLPSGSTSTQPSASTALLAGESDWQRATAPPSNPSMFSSPPAYGEVSIYGTE